MKKSRIRQNVLPILAAMIWGTGFVAQSVGANYVGAFTFNAARSAVAFAFLLGLCAVRRKWLGRRSGSWEDLAKGGLFCGAAMAAASWFQQKGLETTSSGKAGFITALYIVLVPVFSVVLRRKVAASVWVSVALAAAGLYGLCVSEEFTVSTGDAYVFCCAICFSVQILAIDHFSLLTDGVELSCAQFLVAFFFSAAGMALAGERPDLPDLRLSLFPILYAGIFSSGIAYTLQILAQKGSNPTVVSLLLSLESVFATLSGALLLHERMTAREGMGCIIMFCAVILAQLPPPKAKVSGTFQNQA